MQGNLKDAIQYASQNPTSNFALQLADMVKTGQFDTEAQTLGINLAPIKASALGTPPAPKSALDNVHDTLKQSPIGLLTDNLTKGVADAATALGKRGASVVADATATGQKIADQPTILGKTAEVARLGGKVAGQIAGGAGDIITSLVSPFIPQDVKDEAGKRISALATDVNTKFHEPAYTPDSPRDTHDLLHNQTFRDIVHHLYGIAQNNPDVANAVGDALNVVLLGGGKAAESAVTPVLKQGGEQVLDAAGNVINKGIGYAKENAGVSFKTGAADVAAQEAKQAASSIDEAKNVLNPSGYYTPSEKASALKKGNIKVEGKGPFAKETVNVPTTPQTEAVAQLVTDGKVSAKNLPSQNIQALQTEARVADSEIDTFVNRPDLNKPYNGSMIDKVYKGVFNKAKQDLVFVSDTTEQKAYQAVLDVAKEEIAKQPKNMAGLRAGIKAFNARMERILGSDIYSGASESVGNARVTAAKDVRTSLNDFLAENLESPAIKTDKALAGTKVANTLPAKSTYELGNLEGGGVYKAQLRKEAQLLNAADEIAYRAGRTVDKTKLSQWLKAHPDVVKALKVGGYVAGSAGALGTGYGIIKELGN